MSSFQINTRFVFFLLASLFFFWDLNFFFRGLIYLNFILEFQFFSFKSKNFEIWAELLLKMDFSIESILT